MTNAIDPVVAANAERDEARRAADEQADEIARLRARVEAYERQVVAVRVDRAEAIGLTRVTADEARAVAARYDELAGEILKLGTQLEATLADLSQARAELDAAGKRAEAAEAKWREAYDAETKATHTVEQLLGLLGLEVDVENDVAVAALRKIREENARLKAEDERATEHLREMLRKVDEEQNGVAICSWCALPTNSDEASKHTHQLTCPKSPIVTLLVRAVAALQEARGGIATIYHLIDSDREIKAMKACKPITDKIDAILGDATATAAVDAYRAQREAREELEAVYQAGNAAKAGFYIVHDSDDNGSCIGPRTQCLGCKLIAELAKVDARRGAK